MSSQKLPPSSDEDALLRPNELADARATGRGAMNAPERISADHEPAVGDMALESTGVARPSRGEAAQDEEGEDAIELTMDAPAQRRQVWRRGHV